jgi:3-phosphoshikimate 1-carboxyvinyltransferase
MGAAFWESGEPDCLPLIIKGGALKKFSYTSSLSSAQVKSAILLAGLTGRVESVVVEPGRSRDHTERLLRRMGAQVSEAVTPEGWEVGLRMVPSELEPLDVTVPGDFSSAAFLIALALLGGSGDELRIQNVGLNPTRTGLLDLLREMGGKIEVQNLREADDPKGEPAGDLIVSPSDLYGVSVGGELIPLLIDEIPVLAVVAALASGVTEIRDAAELRVKETDRISALVSNLTSVGVRVEELPDGLRIKGQTGDVGGRISVRGDHRIAMAFGVLGALEGHDVLIDDPGVVDVSFPGFWELLAVVSDGDSVESWKDRG